MKLKKWLKMVDPLVDVVIYTPDDDEVPAFEGSALDIPWSLTDYKLGRKDDDTEEPIYISVKEKTYANGNVGTVPVIIINVIDE